MREAEGVDLLFGYPGGAHMPFYDALTGSKLRHILVRHEQGAALAANGYARASGRPVPYEVQPRRPGDVAACYADPALARQLLGWTARLDLDRMCADSWRWQSQNPEGFQA